jgi:hypothetical protein
MALHPFAVEKDFAIGGDRIRMLRRVVSASAGAEGAGTAVNVQIWLRKQWFTPFFVLEDFKRP